MTWVADYSFARPDLAALQAAGCSGIVRYATGADKALEAAEVALCAQLGLTLTVVQEGGNQPALRGFDGGVADASADNAALDQVGYGRDCWCYYVGEDPNRLDPSHWPTVADYFRGVGSVAVRPVGGYGSLALLHYLAALNLITKKWPVEFWGGHDATCHLSQYDAPRDANGNYVLPAEFAGVIDGNHVLQADYGQHPRPAPPDPARLFVVNSGQEASMIVVTHPDGLRQDMVFVNVDGTVGHLWTDDHADWSKAASENLGGVAKTLTATWSKDGLFRVFAHGADDRPWVKVSNGATWIQDWTALNVALHP
jgi:hypothetical protein